MQNLAVSLKLYSQNAFSSLRVRNFRLYFIGQAISISGTWMQSVAQSWLVLKLTDSGTALGLVTALQFLPLLILGPYGGLLADRISKRKILIFTQTCFGLQALALGLLVATGWVRLWMVYALAVSYGLVNAADNPARQSFYIEMVGENELRNAVTLYSGMINLARVIGPLLAGSLIAVIGLAPCFIFNALSFVAVLFMLLAMKSEELYTTLPVQQVKGQLREGLRYAFSRPVLRDVLIISAVIGTLTFEFSTSLPLLARFTFQGDATSYAILTSAVGVGSIIGGLIIATSKKANAWMVVLPAFFFGFTTLLTGLMPTFSLAIIALLGVGVFSIYYTTLANTLLQLESAPNLRGRVMGLWSVVYIGSTAIGAPVIGWVGETFSPRWALAVGGIAGMLAAVYGVLTLGRNRQEDKEQEEPSELSG